MTRPYVADVLQIRKYPNRRYYDATRSRHVKLLDIRKAVQAGCSVFVRDSRTGDDITNQVLGQIILHYDGAKLSVIPSEALHHMIRSDAISWQTVMAAATAGKTSFGKPLARSGFDTPKSMASRDLLIGHLVRQRDSLTRKIGELRSTGTA